MNDLKEQDAVVAAELEKFYKATDKPSPALDMAAAPGAGLIAGVGGLLNTVGIDTPMRHAADTLSPRTRDSLLGRGLMGAGSAAPYVGLGELGALGAARAGLSEATSLLVGASVPATAIGVDAGKQAYERAIQNGASEGAATWSGIAAGTGNAALMMLPMHTFMGQFLGRLPKGAVEPFWRKVALGSGANVVGSVGGKYLSDQVAHNIGNDAEAADLMEAAKELGPESALAGALISGVAAYYGKPRMKASENAPSSENTTSEKGSAVSEQHPAQNAQNAVLPSEQFGTSSENALTSTVHNDAITRADNPPESGTPQPIVTTPDGEIARTDPNIARSEAEIARQETGLRGEMPPVDPNGYESVTDPTAITRQGIDTKSTGIPPAPKPATAPNPSETPNSSRAPETPDSSKPPVARKSSKEYLAEVRKGIADAQTSKPETETIDPSQDKPIGKNAAGESLYERADGSVYRLRPDNHNRPDFGGDLAPTDRPPVSIKNASTDAEMVRMGLDPTEHPAPGRKSDTQIYEEAKAEYTPEVGRALVEDLSNKQRPPTTHEGVLLGLEAVRVTNEQRDAEESWNADPNDVNKARLEAATEAYRKVEGVYKTTGSESSGSLRIRQMMFDENYSRVGLERKLRAAQDGQSLTKEQHDQVKDLAERIKVLEANVTAEELRAKTAQADAAVQALKNEVRSRPRNRAETWIKPRADAAREYIRSTLGTARAGPLDPKLFEAVATIGVEKLIIHGTDFALWSKAMIEDIGDKFSGHLKDVYEASKKQLADEDVKALVARVTERRAADENADVSIKELARHFVRQGLETHEEVTKAIQGVLPQLTDREVRAAISDYGKYRELSSDEFDVKYRELRGVMRELEKLADLKAGKAAKKTGQEHQKPSDQERQLRQKVNEIAKQLGLQGGAHDALAELKTRLKNQITDLQTQIDKGEKIVPERRAVERDPEANALQSRVDELRATYKDLFGSEKTDEQRATAALKHAEESLAEYERKLRENDLWPKTKQGPPTKTVQEIIDQRRAIEARRDALKKEVEQLRNPPLSPEERKQNAAHTRISNELARMLEAKARGDYSRKEKPKPVPLRPETVKVKAELEKVKREAEVMRRRAELAKRTKFQKTMDSAAKINEAAILSTPTVIAKLTSAAVERMIFTPMEEAAGVAFAKMFPRLSEQAPREGGFSPAAEAAAVIQGAKNAAKDFMDTLRTGHSELDLVYSKKYDVEPKSWLDYIRHMHGALKAVTKRNEFARSFQKRMEWEIRAGNDPHDPVVQMRVGTSAYIDANRSIFMNDNAVVDAYKRGMSRFAGPGVTNKIVSTAGKFALPIVKVPTNVVAETFQYALGSVTGTARLARAYKRGISTLEPAEADIILRSLKKGSIGAAVMALGYMNAKNIGGYYAPGKRKEDDVKFGHIKVFGVDVPSMLIHNPLLETLQIGASMRRVADSIKKGEQKGTANGAMAATVGLLEQVPFVRETLDMSKVVEQAQQGSGSDAAGAIVGDRLVPGVVKWAARATDTDKQGETVKRKAVGFSDTVQSGIPWLRKKLPPK